MSTVATITNTLAALNAATDVLPFRGTGKHFFSVHVEGAYTGVVTVQLRRIDNPAAPWIDQESFQSGQVLEKVGENVGGFDVRATMSAYTSGSAVVQIRR